MFQAMNALPRTIFTYKIEDESVFKDSITDRYIEFYDEIEEDVHEEYTSVDEENYMYQFLPRNINKLTNIISINFSEQDLQFLPEELFDLINLQAMSFQINALKFLSPSIGKLVNLKEIYLSHNALTSLPASIGKLKKLEILSIWENKLKTLPYEIADLDMLKRLDGSGNESLKAPFKTVIYGETYEDEKGEDFETLFQSISEHKIYLE